MIATRHLTLSLALTCAFAAGCGGGGGSSSSASTAAGSTGGTTPVVLPGNNGLLKDAMVSSWQLQEVIQVDAYAGTVTNRWGVGAGAADVANGLTETFVASAVSQDVTVIDRLAGSVATTMDPTSTPLTGVSFLSFIDPSLRPFVRPTGVALTPNGNKAYTANLLNVTAIDARNHVPTKSLIGLSKIDVNQLLSDPLTALGNFLSAPVQSIGMAKVAATNEYAVATGMLTGNVMRINALTDQVIDYIPVGRGPIGVTCAAGKAYVACALSQDIWVIDLATGAVRATLGAGMIPVDCATNQAGTRVYVANALSGDISVIDTAADLVVDTLPAGLSITTIFQQMGISLPTGTSSSGIQTLLNGFLQGYTNGLVNPTSFGNLIAGGSGQGLLSPSALIDGLITGFLAYAGVSQQALASMNLPGLGIMSVAVAHDPNYVCAGNAMLGELVVTEVSSRNVNSMTGLTGLGLVDVAGIWKQ